MGSEATERAVKAARSPRILHLATHGFFLSDREPAVSSSRGAMVDPIKTQAFDISSHYANTLVRSGLALAGANNAAQATDEDDGLLTALEVTGMDLSGTQLVVLSACETGAGEVQTGEGVFGLRRAFDLAGAKNLLMSLWPVHDQLTAQQMKTFYLELARVPPAEALRRAQQDTIKQLERQPGGIAPPALWAPFILQGAHAFE